MADEVLPTAAEAHIRALQAELAQAYQMVNELRAVTEVADLRARVAELRTEQAALLAERAALLAVSSPNPTPSFPARALRHWHTPIGLISTIG